jgi:hypothetical protein
MSAPTLAFVSAPQILIDEFLIFLWGYVFIVPVTPQPGHVIHQQVPIME